jgi:hypothetical protein
MGIRKTVFGSSMEQRCFRKLCQTWGGHYRVYHNLPFLQVFTARSALLDKDRNLYILSHEDYDRLKKVSIDFTICDPKDAPLVCIEFDGMQNGFNTGTTYHTRDGSPGRKARRALLELKLRVAHGSLFPYLVLGSEEFRGLSDAVRLTIADGLIGEVLSLRAVNERVSAGFEPTDHGFATEEFEALSPAQQSEIIGDWLTAIEVECDCEHNPISKEVIRLSTELHVSEYGMTFVNDGQHDPSKWVWLDCYVMSAHCGRASAKVCLPEFDTPFCPFSIHVAQEIGQLLALEQLRKRIRGHASGKGTALSEIAKQTSHREPCHGL